MVLGCASYQDVRVTSNPPGAEVFLDQQRVGQTPVDLRIDRDREHAVYVKKDGFQPELVVLSLRSAKDGRKFLTPADVYVDLLNRIGVPPAPGRAGAQDDDDARSPSDSDGARGERERDVQINPDRRPSSQAPAGDPGLPR